ncbi:MAG TPA: hypothetical protein VGC54_09380 [Planctomycetota bacterium]
MHSIPTLFATAVLGALASPLPASPSLEAAGALHIPHANTNAVAVAPHPGGRLEIVALVNMEVQFFQAMRSVDDGLTWTLLSGDGLETARALDVVYHPGLPADGGGTGLFLVATEKGVFAYHPVSGRVENWSAGLTGAGLSVVDVAAPMAGSNGPAMAMTAVGKLYLRFPGAANWSLSLDSGLGGVAERVAIAVAPHFDSGAPTGPGRALVAAVHKRLFYSVNGGATWRVAPRWSSPVNDASGLLITSMAFAEDFRTSGVFALSEGDEAPAAGAIWNTTNFGRNFTRTLSISQPIVSLIATPPGPSGARHFFASPLRNPFGVNGPREGILRSRDGGRTWKDFGNYQDFILRRGQEEGFVSPLLITHLGLAASPDYGNDGTVFCGRDQGLVRSENEGRQFHWLRVRPETDTRDLGTAVDAAGNRLLFGVTYGSGTVRHDLTAGTSSLINAGSVLTVQKSIAVSPNHAVDGTVMVTGSQDLLAWYDPALAPVNPFGVTGWVDLPLYHPTLPSAEGYPRTIALSPHYRSFGGIGFDLTLMWSIFLNPPFRSEDGGLTADSVAPLLGGGAVSFMKELEIAPTYDATTTATKSDVYGLTSGKIYRLTADVWEVIHDSGANTMRVAIDSDYSRPANPRIFVGVRGPSKVLEIVDQLGAPTVVEYSAGLEDVELTDVVVPPSFDQEQVLYVSTIASGVFKLDLNTALPRFEPLGTGLEGLWVKALVLSPDFTADRRIYAGTGEGVWSLDDVLGGIWTQLPLSGFRDNSLSSVELYAPNDPANPEPLRVFPWSVLPAANSPFPGVLFRGIDVSYTNSNAARIEASEYASALRIHTLGGPGMGELQVQVDDLFTGAPIASTSVDLATVLGAVGNYDVEIVLPGPMPVRMIVTVTTGVGEMVVFDGLGFDR